MNKYIKYKKERKLGIKKLSSKQTILFAKKYPRLCVICIANAISYQKVNNAWKKIKRLKIINREAFENMTRVMIVAKQENYVFKEGSRGDYIIKIFDKLGIKLL